MSGALVWISAGRVHHADILGLTGKSATQFLLGIIGLALIAFAAVLLQLQRGAISLL
jgi:hypothetical protein